MIDGFDPCDPDAFDVAVEAMGGARPMLDALLESAPESDRERARGYLPADLDMFGESRMNVPALFTLGPLGLWVSSAWVLEMIPVHERRAPSPIHEQWDAILGVHAQRIEAPWLPIELLASLTTQQRSLGRRILLGLERRFGPRTHRVAAARMRLGDCPLADLLAPG